MSTRPCVVCGRAKAKQVLIDGVPVLVCDECENDAFRRPRAIEFTLKGRPR